MIPLVRTCHTPGQISDYDTTTSVRSFEEVLPFWYLLLGMGWGSLEVKWVIVDPCCSIGFFPKAKVAP